MSTTKHEWKEKTSPARLERRFEFADYDATRAFLDMAAELSKATEVYPDVSFGRTYVNMTHYLNRGGAIAMWWSTVRPRSPRPRLRRRCSRRISCWCPCSRPRSTCGRARM